MTVYEARELKAGLEETIRTAIEAFVRQSGVCVESVYVETHKAMNADGSTGAVAYGVKVRAEL
jgi:hypothetical protein